MNTHEQQPTERSQRIRQVMQTHVAHRLAKALDKWTGKDDAQTRKLIADTCEKYQLTRILEKGSNANGMAVATHIAKGIHPDLKIKNHTNLHVHFDGLPSLNEVGSHVLGSQRGMADTTGDGAYNAAAYELYLLLGCQVDGASLAQLLQSGDPDAIHALSTEATDPTRIAEEVLFLLESKCSQPAAHKLSKQVYWLTGADPTAADDYHLLVPLYPASLAHQAYLQMHPTRYGAENAAARKAKAEGKPYSGVFQEYRGWATQKMGGTKPQNVSHLNSERRGDNYLLSSLPPPAWTTNQRYLPLYANSVFERAFGARRTVRGAVKSFLAFLLTDPEPNRPTRQKVDNFLDSLIDELIVYAGELQSQPAGWTRDDRYDNLAVSEKLWLDPQRAAMSDEGEFAQHWHRQEWPAQVGKRFAHWLNAQLQGKLPAGDAEAREWQRVLLSDESFMVTGGTA